MINKSQKGMTIFEMFVTLAIISVVITMGMPGFNSFVKRMEVRNTLRTITGVLNTARFKAIMLNKRVKFCIEDKNEEDTVIRLKEKREGDSKWKEFMEFNLEKKVSVTINSSPIFFPNGNIAPLCSILVENEVSHYKITISIAGRIKITEMIS
ncbi:MAG: prepilin-type N-terminal cleavage/methylation domain-containing protein [Candidatus Aminicenantes bacterium]|jgi:type IV fimbrial biogenesis protein FimT